MLLSAESGFTCGMLTFGSFTFGALTLGVGIRPSTPRFLLFLLRASPPARPTSAAPPASAGPFAFSAMVAAVDLLWFERELVEVLRRWVGLRERELLFVLRALVVRPFVEPLLLRLEVPEERELRDLVWAIAGPPCLLVAPTSSGDV
jgi:hypothetical protein